MIGCCTALPILSLSHIIITVIFLYYIQPIHGQLSCCIGKYPPHIDFHSSNSIHTRHIPAPSIIDLLHSSRDSKPFIFAKSIPVSISFPIKKLPQHALIDQTHNTDEINRWKIKIHSAGALSLSLIFDTWWLPEGGEVYVYNNNQEVCILQLCNIKVQFSQTYKQKGYIGRIYSRNNITQHIYNFTTTRRSSCD